MGARYYHNLSWELPPGTREECSHIKPEDAKFCPECGVSVGLYLPISRIGDYIDDHECFEGRIDCDGDSIDESYWSECIHDMCKMSEEFLGILFTMDTNGDDANCRDFYLDGKVQETWAELVYDEFDPKKLEFPK